MRNSSLVEWFCAENLTGLKICTEAGAVYSDVYGVGERRILGEAIAEAVVDGIRERMPE